MYKVKLLPVYLFYFSLTSVFCLTYANADTSITSIVKKNSVTEVVVKKTDGFHIGALPYVLKIGGKTFLDSRHPENGDIHTLIFTIPSKEYNKLSSTESVHLGYGMIKTSENTQAKSKKSKSHDQQKPYLAPEDGGQRLSKQQWSFGTLNELTVKQEANK